MNFLCKFFLFLHSHVGKRSEVVPSHKFLMTSFLTISSKAWDSSFFLKEDEELKLKKKVRVEILNKNLIRQQANKIQQSR